MNLISNSYEMLVRLLDANGVWRETPLMHTAVILAGAGVIWLLARVVLARMERRERQGTFLQGHPQVFASIRLAVNIGILALAGTALLQRWHLPVLERLLHAAVIIIMVGPVKSLLAVLITYLEENMAGRTDTRFDDIVFELLGRFAGAIIMLTAFILALDVLGINVIPFVAGAGVAGVAIGFAAKDTLSNLIAGILLIIDRPFEVGDRIEVWSAPAGSASWGDVIDIGLRATKIRTTDNIVVIIPNNEIMIRDIVNYTAMNDEMIRVRVNIGIAYNAPIETAKALIIEVAGSLPWAAAQPPPKVVVRSFAESSIELQLRVWITDARKRMDTISGVTDRVKTAFDAAGIEIPFPRRDITIVQRPAADGAAVPPPLAPPQQSSI